MTDCPHCLTHEREIDALQNALDVTERALHASQARTEKLRGQIQRLSRLTGVSNDYTVREIADRCGVEYQTVRTWTMAKDFPERVPDSYPHAYERGAVEDWIERKGKRNRPITEREE